MVDNICECVYETYCVTKWTEVSVWAGRYEWLC